jgi:hypothetical protein
MREFLSALGFSQIPPETLPGTKEIVYGKKVARETTLRVYTSIAYGTSRRVGEDAIRVALVYRRDDGTLTGIGSDAKVLRIETWKKNLAKRLESWLDLRGPLCPKCNSSMAKREGKYGKFYGCIQYPICRGTIKVYEERA